MVRAAKFLSTRLCVCMWVVLHKYSIECLFEHTIELKNPKI